MLQKKKQPVPIRVTSDLPNQVKKACSCTYMFKNSGTCINIKAGLSSFTQQEVTHRRGDFIQWIGQVLTLCGLVSFRNR